MGSVKDKTGTRVCIIGAGSAGIMALYRFLQLGDQAPEVTCYEKQSTYGGQWNYSWRTDVDEYGETVHSCIYKNLWTNTPKEMLEIPEYTFDKHFGRPTPSFISLPVMHDYIRGIMKTSAINLEEHIQYTTAVKMVQYDNESDTFKVRVTHLPTGQSRTEIFSHVIVASGNYTKPFIPELEGIDTFPGLVIHSKSARRSEIFKDKRVLLIGAGLSGEDVTIHCKKYGASQVIMSYHIHSSPIKFKDNVEQRPMVKCFTNSVVTFEDGTTAEVDVVVLCTGYIYHLPFLEESLRLADIKTSYYPKHLYKGVLWTKGGNQKLYYISAQGSVFSTPSHASQAAWIVRNITGINPLHQQDTISGRKQVTIEEMERECEEKQAIYQKVTSEFEVIDFRTDYDQDLAEELGYKVDFRHYNKLLKDTITLKIKDMMGYRNEQHLSAYTGVKGTKPKVPWAQRFDDSVEAFLEL